MTKFDRETALQEAKYLGLDFKGNISNIKLQEILAEAKGEPAPIEGDSPPPSPASKAAEPEETSETIQAIAEAAAGSLRNSVANAALDKARRRRKTIADARKRAFETRIVTLTNKDNRENDVMTTAYLSFENQHFGLSKLVPLDVPVELERALIEIAASTTMTMHKDEIVDGRRTGNKVPTTVKKFAISYSSRSPN